MPVDLLNFRKVSARVSLHADIVLYDTRENDGTNSKSDPVLSDISRIAFCFTAVGNNPDTTVGNGETRPYTWFADQVWVGHILHFWKRVLLIFLCRVVLRKSHTLAGPS